MRIYEESITTSLATADINFGFEEIQDTVYIYNYNELFYHARITLPYVDDASYLSRLLNSMIEGYTLKYPSTTIETAYTYTPSLQLSNSTSSIDIANFDLNCLQVAQNQNLQNLILTQNQDTKQIASLSNSLSSVNYSDMLEDQFLKILPDSANSLDLVLDGAALAESVATDTSDSILTASDLILDLNDKLEYLNQRSKIDTIIENQSDEYLLNRTLGQALNLHKTSDLDLVKREDLTYLGWNSDESIWGLISHEHYNFFYLYQFF